MSLASLKPGQTLAGYRLIRPLGEGGMGSVWLVVPADTRFGEMKECALKLVELDQGGRNRAHVEALVNEGRAVSRVRHTNVVSLYKLDCDDRYYMAAMEYIAGITFRDLVTRVHDRGVDLPPSLIVDLALGACRGLGAAHLALDTDSRPLGLVHRDVKPTNLMLAEDGTVKVVDFGIAKAASNLSQTASDLTKGTPYYMSPEQWRHEALTPASDLFSLGAVISELVTGRILFHAPGLPQVVTRLMGATGTQDAEAVGTRIPELAPIVARCLERRVQDRYAHAGQLERDLLALRARLAAPLDLAVVARLLGVGGQPRPAAHGITSSDPAWGPFLAAFGSGRPADVPTLAAPLADGGLPEGADRHVPVSVPTLLPRVGAAETERPAAAEEPWRPPRSRRHWAIASGGLAILAAIAVAAKWRAQDGLEVRQADSITQVHAGGLEPPGSEGPPLGKDVGLPDVPDPTGPAAPPTARPSGSPGIKGDDGSAQDPRPSRAEPPTEARIRGGEAGPRNDTGSSPANEPGRDEPKEPGPTANSPVLISPPLEKPPVFEPPPPAIEVHAVGPISVEMGARATFQVTVGPAGACTPVVEIAPGNKNSGARAVAERSNQDGSRFTFKFQVPYNPELYDLGLRFRATCSAEDGRRGRWPADGSWQSVPAAL